MNPDSELADGQLLQTLRTLSGPRFLGEEPYRRPEDFVTQCLRVLTGTSVESNRDGMIGMGRLLIGLGVALIIVGFLVLALERFGLGPGRMPGDIAYRGRNVQVWFPLGTSITLSIVLSLMLYLISRMRR